MIFVKFMLKTSKTNWPLRKKRSVLNQVKKKNVTSKYIFFSYISVNNKTQRPQAHHAEEVY